MVVEVLTEARRGTCVNCGEPVTRYLGDLGSDTWSHDATGRSECPTSTYAEPAGTPEQTRPAPTGEQQ